jgi:hypothetical protein
VVAEGRVRSKPYALGGARTPRVYTIHYEFLRPGEEDGEPPPFMKPLFPMPAAERERLAKQFRWSVLNPRYACGRAEVSRGYYDSVGLREPVPVTVSALDPGRHTVGRVTAGRVRGVLLLRFVNTLYGLVFTGFGVAVLVSLVWPGKRRKDGRDEARPSQKTGGAAAGP